MKSTGEYSKGQPLLWDQRMQSCELLNEISENLQNGNTRRVVELVRAGLRDGVPATDILQEGLLQGIDKISRSFEANNVFVPEVLFAARAFKIALEILKPHLSVAEEGPRGTVVVGTVLGDMHDIGKNLLVMLLEVKGIKVIDLGVDVPGEEFLEALRTHEASVLCCSALLTITMDSMRETVQLVKGSEFGDKLFVVVGGAPITRDFCKMIGADYYNEDPAQAVNRILDFFGCEKGAGHPI